MTIDYGLERQRWKSVLSYDDGNGMETVRSVRYHDDKDIIEEDGKYYSITYLDGGVICLKNLQTNAMSFYLTCTDMLGSVTKVVKGDRTEVFKAEYDEWGRQTVTTNTIGFIRGYTGHEMLPEFGLVNMNGRMYDPLLGRFLSPDDYVQMPMSPQGFNRYAYCLNNPMKYVDPDGEAFGLAHLLTAACGFVSGYLSNAVFSGNWGWNSVRSGLLSAASSLISYGFGSNTGTITSATWSHIAKNGFNEFANKLYPPVSFNINNNFSFSVSPMFGLGDGGLSVGMGISGTYKNGRTQYSAGIGVGSHYMSAMLGYGKDDWSLSYTGTFYPSGNFYGHDIGSQIVGALRYAKQGGSFTFSNDFLITPKRDRWRSFAAELIIGDLSIGTLAGTNNGKKDSSGKWEPADESMWGKYARWAKDFVYIAPLWMGISSGNQITRIGVSDSHIQDFFQNGLHKLMYKTHTGTAKYFLNYSEMYKGMYSYRGTYDPYSLWNR